MAEAIVNLKLAPADFDLLREALQAFEASARALVQSAESSGAEREKARRNVLRAQTLLETFGK